jgi:hypothetical protein
VKKVPPATVRGGEKFDMMKSQPIQRKSPMNEVLKIFIREIDQRLQSRKQTRMIDLTQL